MKNCVLILCLILIIGFTTSSPVGNGPSQDMAKRLKREIPIAADLKNTPCAPNDYFKLECNTCYCNIERSGYLCTENFCPDYVPDKTSEIRLSNDTKVVITNGDVKLVKENAKEAQIDNNLFMLPQGRDLKLPVDGSLEGVTAKVTGNGTEGVTGNATTVSEGVTKI
ncbi:unnamed protein product [Brassicogethes aeneus]|uniref:Pacifastin domain-containing protein n=1 Tax=Brassicogethes aeneus TaxID=1431903 RepID=A0A9P0BJX7_BRAAE|nr:unnamed protein product [Brassicogethes aeneus]